MAKKVLDKQNVKTPFSVEMWPIDKPIPYARNARKITRERFLIRLGAQDELKEEAELAGR